MGEVLTIENGPAIRLTDRPAQGTRHEVWFGVLADTGEPVVVKFERIRGALEPERAALAHLSAHHAPVPQLLAAGNAIVSGEQTACLVLERCTGSPPDTINGWRRMGATFAELARQPLPPQGLPVLDRLAFGRKHVQRASELGDRLAPLANSIPDWDLLVGSELPGSLPLVITHGDPGPGNFLDDGEQGTLIDWEQVHVAPRGLDLARLAFIALLGSGPSGYRARDHHDRARAVITGYLRARGNDWQPSRTEWRWWLTVAGVQFIHRRWQLGDRPAPWKDAAHVLQSALAETP